MSKGVRWWKPTWNTLRAVSTVPNLWQFPIQFLLKISKKKSFNPREKIESRGFRENGEKHSRGFTPRVFSCCELSFRSRTANVVHAVLNSRALILHPHQDGKLDSRLLLLFRSRVVKKNLNRLQEGERDQLTCEPWLSCHRSQFARLPQLKPKHQQWTVHHHRLRSKCASNRFSVFIPMSVKCGEWQCDCWWYSGRHAYKVASW